MPAVCSATTTTSKPFLRNRVLVHAARCFFRTQRVRQMTVGVDT